MKNFKKTTLGVLGALFIGVGLYSCSNDESVLENEKQYASKDSKDSFESLFKNQKEKAMKDFSVSLAISLNQSSKLREIIKKEALEAINLDPEVLFYKIKNESVENGTVEKLIDSNMKNSTLSQIFDVIPTLTVLVPELPEDYFNAIKWDATNEIPAVAVRLMTSNETPIIYDDLQQDIFPSDQIPGFPVLVVKDNERIVSSKDVKFNQIKEEAFFKGEVYSFKFTSPFFSKWFDRIIPKEDQKLVDAFNHYKDVDGWQRDFIYYGISPVNQNGPFIYDYAETISAMTTSRPEDLYFKISDQTGDPFINYTSMNPNFSHWKEGGYEFNYRLTSNSISGGGTSQEFYFPVKPSELFELKYEVLHGYIIPRFVISEIKAKTHFPNVPTLAWNLEDKATEFLMTIFEEDSTEEFSTTTTINSEFAKNFGLSGEVGWETLKKIGMQFGASAKQTIAHTVSQKETKLSDKLGDFVINFGHKVILSKEDLLPLYNKRWYGSDNQYIKFQFYPKRVQ